MDRIDRQLLSLVQRDCTLPTSELAERVGLTSTPCWRRLQNLEASGVIDKRVALLSRAHLNVGVDVFVAVRTSQHSPAWLERFAAAVADFSEVVEAYRMSGDVDYLLRVVVPDIAAYDAFYKRLIDRVEIGDVSSSFAMERMKYTTALPLEYA